MSDARILNTWSRKVYNTSYPNGRNLHVQVEYISSIMPEGA